MNYYFSVIPVFSLALVASLAFLAKRNATVCIMEHIGFQE